MDSFAEALRLCSPSNAEFYITGGQSYSNITWLSSDIIMPTEDQILKKKQELDDALPLIELRNKRDRLLALSDVYMVSDFPLTDDKREKVRIYRQALRDLPTSGSKIFPVLNIIKNDVI